MPNITREWLAEELAKCEEGFAPLPEATDYTLAVIAARTGYPALLQWALAKIEECEQLGTGLALAVEAEQNALERERRLWAEQDRMRVALDAFARLVLSSEPPTGQQLAGARELATIHEW